jgi:hypothetical protein
LVFSSIWKSALENRPGLIGRCPQGFANTLSGPLRGRVDQEHVALAVRELGRDADLARAVLLPDERYDHGCLMLAASARASTASGQSSALNA